LPSDRQERFSEADWPKRSAGKIEAEPDFYAQKSRDMPGWFVFGCFFRLTVGVGKTDSL
jgi:hypothetical protein